MVEIWWAGFWSINSCYLCKFAGTEKIGNFREKTGNFREKTGESWCIVRKGGGAIYGFKNTGLIAAVEPCQIRQWAEKRRCSAGTGWGGALPHPARCYRGPSPVGEGCRFFTPSPRGRGNPWNGSRSPAAAGRRPIWSSK